MPPKAEDTAQANKDKNIERHNQLASVQNQRAIQNQFSAQECRVSAANIARSNDIVGKWDGGGMPEDQSKEYGAGSSSK